MACLLVEETIGERRGFDGKHNFALFDLPAILRSEAQYAREPNLPLASAGTDLAKCVGRDSGVRITEMRRIRCAEPFGAKLEIHPLGELEGAEKAGIQIEDARPTEIWQVAAGVAELSEACGNRSEGGNAEIIARWRGFRAGLAGPRSNATIDGNGSDQIGGFGVPRGVQRGTSTCDGKRCTAQGREQPIELPAAGDSVGNAVFRPALAPPEGQLVDTVKLQIVRAIKTGERLVPRPIGRKGKQQGAEFLVVFVVLCP